MDVDPGAQRVMQNEGDLVIHGAKSRGLSGHRMQPGAEGDPLEFARKSPIWRQT